MDSNMTPIECLRAMYRWPAERPDLDEYWHGWLLPKTAAALCETVTTDARCIVECGTWLGMSSRLILDLAPTANVICCDTWKGSPEMTPLPDLQALLPTLYQQCVRNLWPWRDRVTLVRGDSVISLHEIAEVGVEPDVVYVDSEHSHRQVFAELETIHRYWPRAAIVGDDYHTGPVAAAVRSFSRRRRRAFVDCGTAFRFPPQ